MQIEDALKELGRQMGVPLQLDRNRACRLVFDERWAVDIEAPADRRDTAFIYAVVGKVQPQGEADLFRTLLEANLFGRETAGATLALDRARGEIILQRIVAMDRVNFQDFVAIIEDLIRALAAWSERIATRDQRAGGGVGVGNTLSESIIRV